MMKRILTLALLLLALTGCRSVDVPVYEAPRTLETRATTTVELAEGREPTATKLHNKLVPNGKQVLRLSRNFFYSTQYMISGALNIYSEELDRWIPICGKTDCHHSDESCFSWFGGEADRFFAVREDTVYCVESQIGTNGDALDLGFFALDILTGERTEYYRVEQKSLQSVVLSDAALCGETAILNFDVITEEKPEKMHYVLAFDLNSGTMTRIMERQIVSGELYTLWGMTEQDIIMAYHHSSDNIPFSASEEAREQYGADYSSFVKNLYRWVLLEYPIKENARWSKQVAESTSGSELLLSNFSNFYGGILFYVRNDKLWAYDLRKHTNEVVFECKDIVYMSCFDGKLFYQTEDSQCFYYDFKSEEVVSFSEDMLYFPFDEFEDKLYCYPLNTKKYAFADKYYCFEKEAFYAGDAYSAKEIIH